MTTMTDPTTGAPGITVIGVDTHKDVHVAVALDQVGRKIAEHASSTTMTGLREMITWASTLDPQCRWGIEGTSS